MVIRSLLSDYPNLINFFGLLRQKQCKTLVDKPFFMAGTSSGRTSKNLENNRKLNGPID
jgi:hypothetical protein